MKRYGFARWIFISNLMVLSTAFLHAQSTNVLTQHNNIWRDGLNSTETMLNQTNVTSNRFGKICSTAPGSIDGQIYAQPLVVTGSVSGYNHVVYIETMNNSVYQINGDSTNCAIINHISLLQSQEEAVQCTAVGGEQCATFNPIIGIVGTPVIDTSTNTMYLVTWTQSTAGTCPTSRAPSCFVHRLHALDITTLAEKFGAPVTIPAAKFGEANFTAVRHIQRPGLLELPGVESNGDSAIYVAFSEMDGAGVVGKTIPNGWVMSFDAKNLAASPTVWSSTPDGEGGGIWMSGAGLAAGVDSAGGQTYIYVATGDGTFDVEDGGSDYGESFVKLTTNLTVSSYFTPYNQYCNDIEDGDLASGGVMLIPNGIGSSTIEFALANGKDGNLYILNRADPGGYNGPSVNTCPLSSGTNLNYETVAASTQEFYSTAAFWNSSLYSVANSSPLQKFTISGTACSPGPVCSTPVATSGTSFIFGTAPVVSSNGDTNGTGIVWAVNGNGWPTGSASTHPQPAVLFAYDAQHVQSNKLPLLWNSTQCPTRDGAGNATKFVVPTVANGRVFVGTMDPTDPTNTEGRLDVYGPNSNTCD
jgi:hypothetical protein